MSSRWPLLLSGPQLLLCCRWAEVRLCSIHITHISFSPSFWNGLKAKIKRLGGGKIKSGNYWERWTLQCTFFSLDVKGLDDPFWQRVSLPNSQLSKKMKIIVMRLLRLFICYKITGVRLLFSLLVVDSTSYLSFPLRWLECFPHWNCCFCLSSVTSFLLHIGISTTSSKLSLWSHIPEAPIITTDISIFTEAKLQSTGLKWGSHFSCTVWKLGWLLTVCKMKHWAHGFWLLGTRLW